MKKSILFALVLTFAIPLVSNAQLKKLADNEKIRSFTNGSVGLFKTTIDDKEFYYVTLLNNSRYYNHVVLYLGDKQEMLKNLEDFSETLKNGMKGETFEFQAGVFEYIFSYRTVLGQRCFKVNTPNSSSQDFGNFYKSTIDDIIEYFNKIDN